MKENLLKIRYHIERARSSEPAFIYGHLDDAVYFLNQLERDLKEIEAGVRKAEKLARRRTWFWSKRDLGL